MEYSMRFLIKIFPLFLLFLFACQTPVPESGIWIGKVQLSERRYVDLKMFLNLSPSESSGYFFVGDEATQIPEVVKKNDSLFLIISEYGAELKGQFKNNTLTGRYFRYRADTTFMEFTASFVSPDHEGGKVNALENEGRIKLVGDFQATIRSGDKVDDTKGATFWMKNDSVYGTILDPSGDHGLMVGKQNGTSITLHRFTGWQANMIDLSYMDGRWEGKYYTRNLPPESITLSPKPIFEKENTSLRKTVMREPRGQFAFYGITSEGDTLRNSDTRFNGKALIVDIMGTWCHNCLDAAPVLQQLYDEFKDQGLEIVGLSFELRDDFLFAQKNLRIYGKRHGLTFPLLFTGSTEKTNVDARLRSQLIDFFSYPTTLFIGRDGRVKYIHSGFNGPGTGSRYQQEVQTFYTHVREILKK